MHETVLLVEADRVPDAIIVKLGRLPESRELGRVQRLLARTESEGRPAR